MSGTSLRLRSASRSHACECQHHNGLDNAGHNHTLPPVVYMFQYCPATFQSLSPTAIPPNNVSSVPSQGAPDSHNQVWAAAIVDILPASMYQALHTTYMRNDRPCCPGKLARSCIPFPASSFQDASCSSPPMTETCSDPGQRIYGTRLNIRYETIRLHILR